MPEDVLELIDNTLTDYATSDDAMRWTSNRPAPQMLGPQFAQISLRLRINTEAWVRFANQLRLSLVSAVEANNRFVNAISQAVMRWDGKFVVALDDPPRLRTHAANRTQSVQRRAGSRRTKRYAR